MKPLSIDEIQRAQKRISGYVLETPLLQSLKIQNLLKWKAPVFLKVESIQFTGSFKVRGATNKILALVEAGKKPAHLVAASAGNHAQAVAFVAKSLSIPATIVMPENAPLIKVRNTEELGAKVVLYGSIYDQAFEKSQQILKEMPGAVFVHPYQDREVVAGQGTLGLEILEQLKAFSVDASKLQVVVPIGGGGQFGGVASAIKALHPTADIYGVVADAAPAMAHSFKAKKLVLTESRTRTLAEGLAVKTPTQEMFDLISALAKDIAVVEDHDIAQSIFVLMEEIKLVVEGAGAASLAAVASGKIKADPTRPLVLSLCGGNIDLPRLSMVIEKSLHEADRWLRLEVKIEDRPGELSKVTNVLGSVRANVLEVVHDRLSLNCEPGQTLLKMLLETRGTAHSEQILQAMRACGYIVKVLE